MELTVGCRLCVGHPPVLQEVVADGAVAVEGRRPGEPDASAGHVDDVHVGGGVRPLWKGAGGLLLGPRMCGTGEK